MKKLIIALICVTGSLTLSASTVKPTSVSIDNNPIEMPTTSWIIMDDCLVL